MEADTGGERAGEQGGSSGWPRSPPVTQRRGGWGLGRSQGRLKTTDAEEKQEDQQRARVAGHHRRQGSWWRARPGPGGEGSQGGAGEGRAAGGTAGDRAAHLLNRGAGGARAPPASEQLGEQELTAWDWGRREAWEGTGDDIREARHQSC